MNAVYENGVNANQIINSEQLFTDNLSGKFVYIRNVLKLLVIDTPVLMIKLTIQASRFFTLVVYYLFKTFLFIIPRSVFTFSKNYIRDLCFVIIDSFTWPINLILGIKPIYHDENTINKMIPGNLLLPYTFYAQVIFSDILYPITMNFLMILSIGFIIGLILFIIHRILSLLYMEKLVININPFETTRTLFDNAYNDVKWVLEVVHNTLRTFSEVLRPLSSLRNIDEETITAELKNVHQNYNPMTVKGTMNILSAVKGKVFSKTEKVQVQSKKTEEKVTSRSSTQGTDISFDSMDGELSRRNIILRTDSIDNKSDKNSIQRISSIDLAESLPKDFFQDKNSTKINEDTTVLNNTSKKIDDETTTI